jgi:hypothetical protein
VRHLALQNDNSNLKFNNIIEYKQEGYSCLSVTDHPLNYIRMKLTFSNSGINLAIQLPLLGQWR